MRFISGFITSIALLLLFAAAPAKAAGPAIVVHGDSLAAAYGIAQARGWVALLATRLKDEGMNYRVVNSSVSGETTSGGLARLPKVLAQHRPAVVIIELGSNDGLRGLPLRQMRDNLSAMVRAAQAAGARVLLIGMRMPPNYGPEYTREFEAVYREVATQQRATLLPFLFDGLKDTDEHMQADRLHPNEAAQPLLLENVWPALKPLLK